MHSIWAVARNTLSQALRLKLAVVIVIMLLLLLPLMSLTMVGDRTLQGKLQTFVSYGLSLTSFLLCILTIIVSAFTVSNDLKRKHIYLIASKPIRRFEILLGKLGGIILLDGILLSVFVVIIYVLTMTIPHIGQFPAEQMDQAGREFFTSRQRMTVEIDDRQIQAKAQARYKELKEKGLLKELAEMMTVQQIMGELKSQELGAARAVGPGQARMWEFANVRLSSDSDTVFIRYKHRALPAVPDNQIFGNWRVGDFREVDASGRFRSETSPFFLSRREAVRAFQEFSVPSKIVAEDGYLSVTFFNDPTKNLCTIIPEELQLLYRSGSFTGNYIRVALMIFAKLIFLAAVGVSVSTWLSFPVAILICLAVFLTGTVNGFIVDSLESLSMGIQMAYYFTIRPILWFLPKFDGQYNPTQFIIDGRTVGWLFLGQIYLVTAFIKSAIVMLFGIWIFSNRELARTTV